MSEYDADKAQVVVHVDLRPHDVYTPFHWNTRNIICWVLVLAAGWVVYESYSDDPERWHLGAMPPSAAAFGAIAVLCLGLFVFQYLYVRRLFQKYPVFKKPRQLRFGAEGVHVESEDVRADYKWSLFARVVETPKVFLLLQTASTAMYVPKRCFNSPADIAHLRELIREHFKGPWRLRQE
jgi:hypothetical protein